MDFKDIYTVYIKLWKHIGQDSHLCLPCLSWMYFLVGFTHYRYASSPNITAKKYLFTLFLQSVFLLL